MSRYVPVTLSRKNRDLDWINCLVQIHNLRCGCNEPLIHTVEEIFKQEPTVKEQCLHSGDTLTAAEDAGFGDGDLERLFAEDGDVESTDSATTG